MNKKIRRLLPSVGTFLASITASIIANNINSSLSIALFIVAVISVLVTAYIVKIEFEKSDEIAGSPYIVGPPIKNPAHFFGRKAEVKRFFDNLNGPQPQPLQVLGIRRAGKTSFLRYVSHRDVVRENVHDVDKTLVIYIDLQADVKTVSDFYMVLAEGINGCLPGNPLALPSSFLNRTAFMRWLNSPKLANYRLIFLLDEFEALREEASFDANFFKGLRSLVNTHLGRFAWVTSSYIDLYRLSRDLGKDEKTSPFFNIFHPTPIMLGGLTLSEADDLIRKSAASYGVHFSAEEIVSIKKLAGPLPFFLQTGAEAWFNAKQQGLAPSEIKAKVKQELADGMRKHFDWYWRHFEEDERELLKLIALHVQKGVRFYLQKHGNGVLNDLLRYGLITQEGKKYRIASEVFAEWIRRNRGRVTGAHKATNESARR